MDHSKNENLLDYEKNLSDLISDVDETKKVRIDRSENLSYIENLDEVEKSGENGVDDVLSTEIRKSNRVRKLKTISYASEDTSSSKNVIRKKPRKNYNLIGSSFCCDRCKSPYIVNPLKKTSKITKKKPTPRHKMDPNTKMILTLCNACGLAMGNSNRSSKIKFKPTLLSPEDKEKYLDEGKSFASLLAKVLDNSNATQLYCVKFKKQGCGCLQNFLKSDDDFEETKKRANHLLDLIAEAKQLSQQKCYTKNDITQSSSENIETTKTHKCRGSIGLGNGQKRSAQFEEFVLKNRMYLREQLNLCERATQTILSYSNNFLHKRLKTDPNKGPRIQRKKGKAALGLLIPIDELPGHHCCNAKCVLLATTHSHLLSQWRERASTGQAEARRVLAEMLIPCGGARTNCYRFISMVTGCSHSTICNVSEQMRRTGGNKEPPEHGLKQWWKEHPRSKPIAELNEEINENEANFVADELPSSEVLSTRNEASSSELTETETTLQLQIYKQQLIQLQLQVTQQQVQLQQQQQIIEQQLLNPQIVQWQHVLQQALRTKTNTAQDSVTSNRSINSGKIFDNSLNQLNKEQFSNAESILQKMLLDCPNETSNLSKTVDCVTSHNLITEYPPGLNITILHQSVSDTDTSSTDHVASQMIATSGFENVVFIDPTLISNSSESQSQSVNSATNLFNTSS